MPILVSLSNQSVGSNSEQSTRSLCYLSKQKKITFPDAATFEVDQENFTIFSNVRTSLCKIAKIWLMLWIYCIRFCIWGQLWLICQSLNPRFWDTSMSWTPVRDWTQELRWKFPFPARLVELFSSLAEMKKAGTPCIPVLIFKCVLGK